MPGTLASDIYNCFTNRGPQLYNWENKEFFNYLQNNS